MKSIISLGLLIGSLGYAQFALSDCNYPKMNMNIPNGATATVEDMVAAQTDFKAYNSDMDAYLACLDDQLSKISEDLDIYPDIKTGSVIKKVIVNLRMPSAEKVEDPEYIILEDSTTFSTNYLLLNADAGSPDATGTMKMLGEWSSESGSAGIKTRYTVTPGASDATANDDFGYTETTEFFNDNIDNDPVTGLDVQL